MLFKDRTEAGKRLASLLRLYGNRPRVVVIALPRGGVPVAAEVAREINAPLDVLVVRKLGVPGTEEMAMGAIASGNIQFVNQDLVDRLGVPPEVINTIVQREQQELQRRELAYRDGKPPLDLQDRDVILVDDGLATGATVRVAIQAAKQQHPHELTVAVPIAEKGVCQRLATEVDRVVCAETPQPFHAVGLWYEDFPQTTDEEVRSLLLQARHRILETAGHRS